MSIARRHLQRKAAGQSFDFEAAAAARAAAAADLAAEGPESGDPVFIGVDLAGGPDQTVEAANRRPGDSLARRHRERISAGQHLAAANDNGPVAAEEGPRAAEYGQLLLQLVDDKRRLKAIQSIEAKVALKKELLPRYDAWIEGTLEAAMLGGRGVQDEIVSTCLMWRIDVGDYMGALKLAYYCMTFGLALPGHVQRDLATFVTEEISEGALQALKAGEPAPLDVLVSLQELTRERDMPDQVRAKLHKALGKELLRQAEDPDTDAAGGAAGGRKARLGAAHDQLTRAQKLDPKAGVAKDIERAARELKKAGEAEPAPDAKPD